MDEIEFVEGQIKIVKACMEQHERHLKQELQELSMWEHIKSALNRQVLEDTAKVK